MFKNAANLESNSKSSYPKISQRNIISNGTVYSTSPLTSEIKEFQINVHFNKWT